VNYAYCYCGDSTPPAADAVSWEYCNNMCPVEFYYNTEHVYGVNYFMDLCGGTDYFTVVDLLRTVGGVAPQFGEGSLCALPLNPSFRAPHTGISIPQGTNPPVVGNIVDFAVRSRKINNFRSYFSFAAALVPRERR